MFRLFRSILSITTIVMVLSTLILGGVIFYGAALYRNANIEQQNLSEWFANKLEITHSLSTKYLEHSQEWKSILLRGQDSNQYHAHLSHFFELEREIRSIVNELKIDIARGNDSLQLLTQFDMEFRLLGKDYRGAIRAYNSADDNPHLIADKLTQNAKIPETLIADFVIAMNAWRNTEIMEITGKTNIAERSIIIILSVVLLLSLVIVIFILRYWVIIPIEQATNHANRIATGFLDNYIITEHISNEASSLMSALSVMQSNIKKSQTSLVDERKRADKASEAKSLFISSMSHELRTPMNVILGYSQLLEVSAKDETTKENVQEIINAGDHLLQLINQVLALSEIESERVPLSIYSYSLNDLLNNCLSMMKSMAVKRSITIDNKLDPSLNIMVNVDKDKFSQVLKNLLSNAIKYNSENGKVTIDCSSNDKNMLCLSITDTGKGLTPEQKSHLFRPFDRAGAENSNIAGTGLGLLISKDLIEKMSGTIGFESEINKGSRFWIQVPIS